LGIDARDGLVATDGWLATSTVPAVELAQRFQGEPLGAVIYTDISCDGMLSGPNLTAMRLMNDASDVPVIASGGVTSVDDVRALADAGLAGCIIGRSLYEGRISLQQAHEAARSPMPP
jgi:phosphoribosylformimino-5-aminoimidazole carboxamide ribotide isomerase